VGYWGTSFKTQKSQIYKLKSFISERGIYAGYLARPFNFSDLLNFSKDNLEYTQPSIFQCICYPEQIPAKMRHWNYGMGPFSYHVQIQDKDIRTTSLG